MVHWLGDGTNVMICLAREPPLGPLDDVPASAKPSAVYISYDYGDTFVDKTLLFTVPVDRKDVNGKQMNSTLDQFVTNPSFNTVSQRVSIIMHASAISICGHTLRAPKMCVRVSR